MKCYTIFMDMQRYRGFTKEFLACWPLIGERSNERRIKLWVISRPDIYQVIIKFSHYINDMLPIGIYTKVENIITKLIRVSNKLNKK